MDLEREFATKEMLETSKFVKLHVAFINKLESVSHLKSQNDATMSGSRMQSKINLLIVLHRNFAKSQKCKSIEYHHNSRL